jgi:alpha-glucosidase
MLHLVRRALAARRASEALRAGELTLLDDAPEGVLAYERSAGDDRRRVWVNFGASDVDLPASGWDVVLRTDGASSLRLPPDAAAILAPAG